MFNNSAIYLLTAITNLVLVVATMQKAKEKWKKCPFSGQIWSFAISAISLEHSPIVVDYRSPVICRNNRCVVSADVRAPIAPKFIACVHACGGDQDHGSFSDWTEDHGAWTGFARESISDERACTRTRSKDGKEEEKDESEQARKKGKEEEKESEPRGRSHPEFEVGRRTCNRVSWLRRRIRCPVPFPTSCLVTCARTKKRRARQKEKLPDLTRFFARA